MMYYNVDYALGNNPITEGIGEMIALGVIAMLTIPVVVGGVVGYAVKGGRGALVGSLVALPALYIAIAANRYIKVV